MDVVMIAAVAANGVIGRDGTLPWHLPDDLAHFKATTMGDPVIMGRRAFEDILEKLGRPLPGRTNIVLTRTDPDLPPAVTVARSVEDALEEAFATGSGRAFVAGGACVYGQFLDRADEMVLSELHASVDGDVRFPQIDRSAWIENARERREAFDIVWYRSVRGGSSL